MRAPLLLHLRFPFNLSPLLLLTFSPCALSPRRRAAARVRRGRARLHQLLEAAEVFVYLLLRVLAERPRDERAEFAARRVVLQRDAHDSPAVRRLLEAN